MSRLGGTPAPRRDAAAAGGGGAAAGHRLGGAGGRGPQWSCPACTFLNEPATTKCKMCWAEKPAAAAAKVARSGAVAKLDAHVKRVASGEDAFDDEKFRLHQAVHKIRGSGCASAAITECLKTLHQIVENVSFSDDPKYRSLRKENKTLQQKVFAEGLHATEFLGLVGFHNTVREFKAYMVLEDHAQDAELVEELKAAETKEGKKAARDAQRGEAKAKIQADREARLKRYKNPPPPSISTFKKTPAKMKSATDIGAGGGGGGGSG